jgi:hypothetical protein
VSTTLFIKPFKMPLIKRPENIATATGQTQWHRSAGEGRQSKEAMHGPQLYAALGTPGRRTHGCTNHQ